MIQSLDDKLTSFLSKYKEDSTIKLENKVISIQTSINANSKDLHFDELTVNHELTVHGELEIMSSI